MNSNPTKDTSTLRWVRSELNELLRSARRAIEGYVEGDGDASRLQECRELLHQVRGALRMVQVYGGAMLADEMEQVVAAMASGHVEDTEQAAEGLMGALVQLPIYLERLEGGNPDIPLIFLPLLNELRVARSEKEISEVALFAPKLTELIESEPVVPGSGSAALIEEIHLRRTRYQRGLLNWYRDPSNVEPLRGLRDTIEALNGRAGTARMRRLLDAAEALTVTLIEHGEPAENPVRALYGRLDRFLKAVGDRGEEAAVAEFPIELLRAFLYHVTRSDSDSPSVAAVREIADQANSFVPVASIAQGASLGGPDKALFDAVSDALREDLRGIKDELDLYIRGALDDRARLLGLIEPLQRVGDTLGMIGRGVLRERLQSRCNQIRTLTAVEAPPDDDALMAIASELLGIESAIAGLEQDEPLPTDGEGGPSLSEYEYREHAQVAVNEAIFVLKGVKDTVGEYLKNPKNTAALAGVPDKLHTVAGALRILDQSDAGDVLDGLSPYLNDVAMGRKPVPDAQSRDALADVIIGVEYFLEAVQEGRENVDDIITYARDAGERLHRSGRAAVGVADVDDQAAGQTMDNAFDHAEDQVMADAVDQSADQLIDQPIHTDVPSLEIEQPDSLTPMLAQALRADSEPAAPEEPVSSLLSDNESVLTEFNEDIDSEIREIFLEEASEELDVIRVQYPKWRDGGQDAEPLQIFRRSFHTLKGSGRLVGANTIGEFSWSIENLLNRIIDGMVEADSEVIALLDEACDFLPELISAQGGGPTPAAARLHDIAGRATQLALGEALGDQEAPAEPAPVEAPQSPETRVVSDAAHDADEVESTLPAPLVMDAALERIFRNECDTHLAELDAFCERYAGGSGACEYDDELVRALHTLHGSANMASALPVAELAHGLERFVNLKRERAEYADAVSVDMLRRGAQQIRGIVDAINRPGAQLPEWERLQLEIVANTAQIENLPFIMEPATSHDAAMPTGPASLARSDGQGTAEAEGAAGVDPELLEIFLEEARELTDAMDAEFSLWQNDAEATDAVANLQRSLHTVKGGARLSGAMQIGNLSHALESLFEAVQGHQVKATPQLQALARRGMDQLANAVEILQDGAAEPETEAMIERIEAALVGEYDQEDSVLSELLDLPSESASQLTEPEEVGGLLDEDQAPVAEQADLTPTSEAEDVEFAEEAEDSALLEDSEWADSALTDTPSPETELTPLPLQSVPDAQSFERRPLPPAEDPASHRTNRERVRVRADMLDEMVNSAGEVTIFRSRLEEQNNTLGYNLQELERTTARLRMQLRQLEIETEAQILSRHEGEHHADFDPLELDRYSTIQELSRALSETVNDLGSIGSTLDDLRVDTEAILLQHARVGNVLQDDLLRTRMIPFGSRVARLQRVVRQTAQSLGKQADLTVQGTQSELDRAILDRMIAPLEHLLRNAVAHGIESPEQRAAAGKPEVGRIILDLAREGGSILITISDDGVGLDREGIRAKAIERGILDPDAEVVEGDIDQFILEPGFTTAAEVTQIAGRGVGMDVVLSETKQLGGSLLLESEPGNGVKVMIRLPFTLALADSLLVQQGDEVYAIPHGGVSGVVRITAKDVQDHYAGKRETVSYQGKEYGIRYLGAMLTGVRPNLLEGQRWYPLLLVQSGEHNVAIHVDAVLGNRQIVVKPLGAQLASIRSFSGATILGDGRAALILDMNGLVRMTMAQQVAPVMEPVAAPEPEGLTVMVVDDSITVRKVTSRLLERHNMRVVTAKDGVDAIALLQDVKPDCMLLDIEMPRMDGFELARHMQHSSELSDIPIIMITSRTGTKHRERADSLGVKRYLGKPYQEMDLLEHIYGVLGDKGARS